MAARVIERIEPAIEVSTGPGRDAFRTVNALPRTMSSAGFVEIHNVFELTIDEVIPAVGNDGTIDKYIVARATNHAG